MKPLFYNVPLLVAMWMANQSMAQDQKRYRFSLKGTGRIPIHTIIKTMSFTDNQMISN
jgi:hypothetical protein